MMYIQMLMWNNIRFIETHCEGVDVFALRNAAALRAAAFVEEDEPCPLPD